MCIHASWANIDGSTTPMRALFGAAAAKAEKGHILLFSKLVCIQEKFPEA